MADQVQGAGRRIVVGVDGSACSEAALRWAMAQARLVDARVEALGTWQYPAVFGLAYGSVQGEGEVLVSITQQVLDKTVAEVVGQGGPHVEVVTRVVQGHPAEVLVEAARGAELLVVGSHGHSTVAGRLLGSVSQHCVQHAPCPVVVVPM
jgi:nucleotide-binding universal stress UspA family protein